MIKNTDEIPVIKNAKLSPDVDLGDNNSARIVLVTPEMFPHYRIKRSDFSAEPKDGDLVAFALFNNKNEPVGIALGKLNESSNDSKTGILTIGSIKYNDSTPDHFYQPTEKLKKEKQLVVDFQYDEHKQDIIFPGESIGKIAQFIINMANEHKARQSSLEIDAPRFVVADAGEAVAQTVAPTKPATKRSNQI